MVVKIDVIGQWRLRGGAQLSSLEGNKFIDYTHCLKSTLESFFLLKSTLESLS